MVVSYGVASLDYRAATGNSRGNQFDGRFFLYTLKLLSSLPSHVFPNKYD